MDISIFYFFSVTGRGRRRREVAGRGPVFYKKNRGGGGGSEAEAREGEGLRGNVCGGRGGGDFFFFFRAEMPTKFSEVFQRPSQRPSQSAIFLSELRVVLPLILLPLKTPTKFHTQRKPQKSKGGGASGHELCCSSHKQDLSEPSGFSQFPKNLYKMLRSSAPEKGSLEKESFQKGPLLR